MRSRDTAQNLIKKESITLPAKNPITAKNQDLNSAGVAKTQALQREAVTAQHTKEKKNKNINKKGGGCVATPFNTAVKFKGNVNEEGETFVT